ncbi:MAG: hypothetical protein CSB44_00020 [Gammaproteobacteria bacterium]|nr:MAG: hypothetical protein CSB44_00020 [Gammaproteobacteria bacterium]
MLMKNDSVIQAMLVPRKTSESVNSVEGLIHERGKNLVLDIGNVIVRWDPLRLIGTAFDTEADRRQALADTIANSDWVAMDRGTMTLDEAVSRAQARSPLPPERIRMIYDNLAPSLTPLEDTMAAMKEVAAKGVPIYILSNMQHHPWVWLRENYDCWSVCQGMVVSCDTGFVKPEPEIYRHLTDTFSLDPDTCVFVDDVAVNVEAARAAGWQSVQLTEREAGGAILRALGEMLGNQAATASST